MRFLNIFFIIIFLLLLTATTNAETISSRTIKKNITDIIDFEEVVYTKIGLWTEKGHILATNYSRGEFIPVNSPVKITKITSSYIIMKYDNSIIYLKNTKYTNIDIYQLFERSFSVKEIDLSKFSKEEQEAIIFGDVINGMSKDAVIISRGYPPAHQTRSLKSNRWKYWNSKFDTISYKFRDNRVFQIKE